VIIEHVVLRTATLDLIIIAISHISIWVLVLFMPVDLSGIVLIHIICQVRVFSFGGGGGGEIQECFVRQITAGNLYLHVSD